MMNHGNGETFLLEINDGNKPPSARKKTDAQVIWHDAWRGKPVRPLLINSLWMNLLTQTVLWMALLVFFAQYRITLVIAEILIWLAEGLLFHVIPASQLSVREAPLLSLGMNVPSFTLGLFLPV